MLTDLPGSVFSRLQMSTFAQQLLQADDLLGYGLPGRSEALANGGRQPSHDTHERLACRLDLGELIAKAFLGFGLRPGPHSGPGMGEEHRVESQDRPMGPS